MNSELGTGLTQTDQGAATASQKTDAKELGTNGVRLPHGADAFTSMTTPGNTAYKIGPLDVLDIKIFKVPDLTRSVQVADTGTINLPLVGDVQAAGKTANELERDLVSALGGKYLQSPQVSIFIKEYNSQRLTIDGAVKKPGVYPLRGKMSLLQLIATAEGLNDISDASDVVVFRTTDNKRYAAKFDVNEIRAGKSEDPAMRPGDTIVVGTSQIKAALQDIGRAVPITSAFLPLL